ncbi:MAG: GGDEF domain-containing protein [candidate division Zixibacteria bacterium]|nr:GGDEF domain-containing protein [candidate division Zixibacteria bacterium]
MTIEQSFIVVLAFLAILLAFLLVQRITGESRRTAALRRLDMEDFDQLLRTNARQGVISNVGSRVSNLLKGTFGCSRILFLRKKRGQLRLNYSHGLDQSDASGFRLPASSELDEKLREEYMLRNLSQLKPSLPSDYYERLVQLGIDSFFPIFWRDNLYGVYFICSTLETRERSFRTLVASLGQVLSAAYHVKWHESRHDELRKKLDVASDKPDQPRSVDLDSLMGLIRHRKAGTMVSRIFEVLTVDVGWTRAAFFHRLNSQSQWELDTHEISPTFLSGHADELSFMVGQLSDIHLTGPAELKTEHGQMAALATALEESGLEHVMVYSVSSGRDGVLAWSGGGDPVDVSGRLETLRSHLHDLIDNAESFERIEGLSYTDNLTGLANQRYFLKRLDEEISRAERYGRHLAFILFDLDELKATNDTYGHLAGDDILRQLGEILRNSIRSIDVVARYGGDEFCVIMPEADQETCRRFMRRLQATIAGTDFQIEHIDEPIKCTVSLGGSIFPDHGKDSRGLIHAADMALLRAKESGRNRSLIFELEPGV